MPNQESQLPFQDENANSENPEMYRFSFQFFLPMAGSEMDDDSQDTEALPQRVQVIRFTPLNNSNDLSQNIDISSLNNDNTSRTRGRRLRPLRHRFEQQQAQDFIEQLQQNASIFAAIAIRQLFMDGSFPNMEHLQGQPTASKMAVDSLPILHSLTEKRRLKHSICSICQEDFQYSTNTSPSSSASTSSPTIPNHQSQPQNMHTNLSDDTKVESLKQETFIRMPCHHIFHKDCLTPWLISSSATCPTCRYEIQTDNEDYNRGVRERMKERDELLKLDPDTDLEDEADIPSCVMKNIEDEIPKSVITDALSLPESEAKISSMKKKRTRRQVNTESSSNVTQRPDNGESSSNESLRRSKRIKAIQSRQFQ